MALIRDGGGAGGSVGRALLCLSLAVLALPFCAASRLVKAPHCILPRPI
jgi:hypothetical protein